MAYIIKNNLPKNDRTKWFLEEFGDYMEHKSKKIALFYFNNAIAQLKDFNTKSFLRSDSVVRGTIQVEIDGFYYYVELYKE